MMICDEVERNVDPYVDRELTADAAEPHAASTSARAGSADSASPSGRRSAGCVRSAPYYAAPERLRRACRQAAALGRGSARRLLTWAAAAALVVSIGGGISLVRTARTATRRRCDGERGRRAATSAR